MTTYYKVTKEKVNKTSIKGCSFLTCAREGKRFSSQPVIKLLVSTHKRKKLQDDKPAMKQGTSLAFVSLVTLWRVLHILTWRGWKGSSSRLLSLNSEFTRNRPILLSGSRR